MSAILGAVFGAGLVWAWHRVRGVAARGVGPARTIGDPPLSRRRALDVVRHRDAALAVLSQDLRTPLQAVIGYAELALEEGGDPGQVPMHLLQIHRAARQLGRRVESIVHLSISADPSPPLEVTRVDVAGVLGDAVALVAPDLRRSGASLLIEGPERDAWVATDLQRLREVVAGMLFEAIAATRGNRLRLRWSLASGWLRLEVLASGPGACGLGQGVLRADLSRAAVALSGGLRVGHDGSGVILEVPDLEVSQEAVLRAM